MNICVCDDERPIMQLCVMVLEALGHAVDGYTRGEEALARLEARPADILVVDYKMPGLNGVEVVRRARALHPKLRVIMITGHGTPDIIAEARSAGVETIVLKPFTPTELMEAVAGIAAVGEEPPA
jgi:CheY-like chemotaxis protein